MKLDMMILEVAENKWLKSGYNINFREMIELPLRHP